MQEKRQTERRNGEYAKEIAKEAVKELFEELGLSIEDRETIKNMVVFFKGIGATRKLLMWTAGIVTAIVAILMPVSYLVKRLL